MNFSHFRFKSEGNKVDQKLTTSSPSHSRVHSDRLLVAISIRNLKATSRMYKALVYWPLACSACEISAMTNSARMRPWKPQLQHKILAMTGSAQMRPMESQLQQKEATFPMGYPARETRGSSAHMIRLEPQLQEKNATFSFNRNHEEFGPN